MRRLGTALAGSVLIASLTASFLTGIAQNPDVPQDVVDQANVQLATGGEFISDAQLESALDEAGVPAATADAILDANEQARLDGLRAALGLLAVIAVAALFFTKRIPTRQPGGGTEPEPGAPPRDGPPSESYRWVPALAASGTMRSARKRSGANGAISGSTRPVASISAIVLPKIGAPLKPQVPMPDIRKKLTTSLSPSSGDESGVMSHRPVHWRISRAVAMNGSSWIVRFAASAANSNVERVEYVL